MDNLSDEIKNILLKNLRCIYDKSGMPIYLYGPVKIPITINGFVEVFNWYTWIPSSRIPKKIVDCDELCDVLHTIDTAYLQQSSILTFGDFHNAENALVRIHSICHTGDIFGSKRCDCGGQLQKALEKVVKYGVGGVIYVADQEGRGIGLFNKAMAYTLQENGYDTVEANVALGFKEDNRNFDEISYILKELRNKKITLLSNNPYKYDALTGNGVIVEAVEQIYGDATEYNLEYLKTKYHFFGHKLEELINS